MNLQVFIIFMILRLTFIFFYPLTLNFLTILLVFAQNMLKSLPFQFSF